MTQMEERVTRGMAWLDEVAPGWIERVSAERLEMADPCNCVLGQIFEDLVGIKTNSNGFAVGAMKLWEDQPATEPATDLVVGFGFNAKPGSDQGKVDQEYAELEKTWLRLMAERQA